MTLGLSWGLRLGVLMLAVSGGALCAQTGAGSGATKNDAEVQKEDLQAQALYQQQNFLGSLPLFEDLHQQRPDSNVFRERLAMCLLAKAATEAPSDATVTRERAKKLLLENRAAGDNSNLLRIVLEKLSTPSTALAVMQKSPGAESMLKGEKAFSNGDLKKALELYKEAAEADPKLYEAALFAGDTEFKRKNYDEAGTWFAKAIAINPDRETAYRYWGDVLMQKGEQKAARGKFVDAVIAEPYSKASWVGLQQWANASNARLASPPITLPKQAVPDEKGNVRVTIDPSKAGDPASGAWLVYSTQPMMWRSTEFKKRYPNETVYRHSLAEEAEGLRSVIAVVKEQNIPEEKLDPTLKSLLALEKDGMLECWILLNGADQGIVQDYAAYRATHRELLHAYLDKDVIHFNQPS
jgi:tetratricopeptide (TPR) repeat protein